MAGRSVREATFDVFREYGLTSLFANPGSTEIDFLADPRHPENGALYDALNGAAYNLVQSSLNQVVAVMGHGNINNVPPAARDWRASVCCSSARDAFTFEQTRPNRSVSYDAPTCARQIVPFVPPALSG